MALFNARPNYAGSGLTFKDFAAQDIDTVFFNGDEHAEVHDIDGKSMLVVLEEDDTARHKSHWEWGRKGSMDDGLYKAGMILYVKTEDYGPKPKVGKELILDADKETKRTFRIIQCEEDSGVYRMTLERARQ